MSRCTRLPVLVALLAAPMPALADYDCSFDQRCLAGGICERDRHLAFAVKRENNDWRLEADDIVIPVSLSPEAGTYFGHVFIGAKGTGQGTDAFQLSVTRDGAALFSQHHVGSAPFGMLWRGRCEEVG